MKPKHDDKNLPQPTSNEAITRRRLKKFNDQLRERPELLAEFESILGIAADGGPDAPFRMADEVEALVVEAMRKLGHQTMTQWAQEAQVRAVEDCKQEPPGARLKKKPAELVVRVWRGAPRGTHAAHRDAPRAAAFCAARPGP